MPAQVYSEYKIETIIFYKNRYYKVCADTFKSKTSVIENIVCTNCQIQLDHYPCIPGDCSASTRIDKTGIHYKYATKQEAFKAFMLGELKCL